MPKGGSPAAKGGVVTRPTAPTVKGKLEVIGGAAYDEEEEDDDDEVGEGGDAGDNLDEEMAALGAATKNNASTKRKSTAKEASTTKKLKGSDHA